MILDDLNVRIRGVFDGVEVRVVVDDLNVRVVAVLEVDWSVRQLLSYGKNLKKTQKYIIHKPGGSWNWHEAREDCKTMGAQLPLFFDKKEWIIFQNEFLPWMK